MIQIEVQPQEILEVLQAEFPKEFTIAVQRVHIRKLEERLNGHVEAASNGQSKEVSIG